MTCDKCGKGLYPDDDLIYHEDTSSLVFVAEESGWKYIHGKGCLCPEHWEYDDKDEVRVKD